MNVQHLNSSTGPDAKAERFSKIETAAPHPDAKVFNDLLPARMLNEFVYCPRLFYYEQVEGIFLGNEDTERGSSLHLRVDRGSGALPSSKSTSKKRQNKCDEYDTTSISNDIEEVEEKIHSRSVSLSSERLGVIAKMDLIEIHALHRKTLTAENSACTSQLEILHVTPVEYKAGAPKQGLGCNELWDTDKIQLGLQILILQDNGYECNQGVIYYRGTKQRVNLEMTQTLQDWIFLKISEARKVAAAPQIPPPLENDAKCVRCSLAPVCLPDETRWLRQNPPNRFVTADPCKVPPTSSPPVRRLIASRDDERALYLNTQGCRVGIKSERIVVKNGDVVVQDIRLIDVSHVALFGNVQCSTQAIQQLCEHEIPIAYFSMGGWFYGLTRGHGLKNVQTRIRQFAVAANPILALKAARKFVMGKIRNHRTLLMRLHVQPPKEVIVGLKEISLRVPRAQSIDELLGMEGAAASLYFQHFPGMIKVGHDEIEDDFIQSETTSVGESNHKSNQETFKFDFSRRRRRPPTDPVNALLSLAYSLLAKDCTIAALAVGFDPYIGFYHQPRHGRPSLALDMMEEFRPLIAESAVLTAINNRILQAGHFIKAGDAVNLTPQGRKAFFHVYEQRMNTLITHPVFDYKVSYRRVLELQARLLARWLTGEIEEYIPMITR